MSKFGENAHLFDDGMCELECRLCGEPLLMKPGDEGHIVVEHDGGEGYPICSGCYVPSPDSKKRVSRKQRKKNRKRPVPKGMYATVVKSVEPI